MRRTWFMALLVLAGVAGSARPVAAQPADAPAPLASVVQLPLQLPRALADERAGLNEAVARGLGVFGRPVIGPESLVRQTLGRVDLARCHDAGCWGKLYEITSGRYLVQGAVQAKSHDAYTVELTLIDAQGSVVLGSEKNDCDVARDCSLGEILRLTTRELLRYTLPRSVDPAHVAVAATHPASHAQAPTPPPAAAPYAAPAIAGNLTQPQPSHTDGKPLAWVGVWAGAACVAAGLAYLAVNGTETDCEGSGSSRVCYRLRKTTGEGIASLAVGAVLAGAGTTWLLTRPTQSVSVAVGPGSALFVGSF